MSERDFLACMVPAVAATYLAEELRDLGVDWTTIEARSQGADGRCDDVTIHRGSELRLRLPDAGGDH